MRTTKVPIFDAAGRPRWLVGITEDVTAKIRLDEERETARSRAEEASRVKSQFLANMSHEIRTPMNGVLGLLALALDEELPSGARDLVELAQGSAHHLLSIINDILDISKIENGAMTMESTPFSLRDVIRDAMVLHTPKADEKGIELVIDVAPDVDDPVRGDSVRVRQILMNLIGNAVKFTSKGEVRVEVERERAAEGARVVFRVVDTGIGIREDKLEHVFLPFSQGDESTTRKYGGTGLGLSICRELARRMGGDVRAESELGKGSTFEVILALPSDARAAPPPWSGMSILLVGLQDSSVRATSRALRGLGALVTILSPESDLSAALASALPSVVVVDGAGAALAMAHGLRATDVPIVELATSGGKSVERHGATCTLRKPATSNDLHRAVERAMSKSSDATGPRAAPAVATSPTEIRGLRVLLAEDNPVNTRVAVLMLEKLGCHVVSVENGLEALARFQGGQFDLALLDVQMPVMDGLACARAIRAAEGAGEHTPLIALTANAMKGDEALCLAAGMDSYLTKPIDRAKLHEEIVRSARTKAPASQVA